VLISHDHYDHLDMDAVRHLAQRGSRFFVPLGIGAHLELWGVPLAQIEELEWWQERSLGSVRIVCTPRATIPAAAWATAARRCGQAGR
jgi:L-ascorbate metabolism protein UlaG (beta-lactamase superfamily)